MSAERQDDAPAAANGLVADILRRTADKLTEQNANPFRINAYRRAAQTLDGLSEDLRDILDRDGRAGLVALPAIGQGLATTIEEILRTGRSSQLDRLDGALDPERLFQSIPGIGPKLAHDIHESLHVDTLEALEVVAHDGRLESVPGLGPRRAAGIRANLESLLGGRSDRMQREEEPMVATLLEVDSRYRRSAASDELPVIAPKRFNPKQEAWLPILHADEGGWHFTVLFSNTARAHQLGRTRDWVVIYFYDGDHREGQHTVVTETQGPLKGRRVVRGREAECRRYYDQEAAG